MLPRQQRLRRRKDFLACYNEGKAYTQPHLVMYLRPQREGQRFGFVVGKKVGKAVVRNRVKRRLRAACRECLPHLRPGFDAVIVARRNVLEADYRQLLHEMRQLFQSAKVWKADERS
ncbi:MAG: ribonuclease P protein component [Armatimonadota bacterium]|nr:ribonuclease P protein component [Armatimonadota bacterium]MDW8289651.1 ribonuclease P protein component [Armatimonadota bacterium]